MAGRARRTAAIMAAADIPDHKPGDGFEAPKVWWTPSVSPGALMIYSGDKFPQWKGDALVGALSGEALIRIDIDGDKARKADHWPMGARIRAVDQGPDGSVYLLEDRRAAAGGSIRNDARLANRWGVGIGAACAVRLAKAGADVVIG